MYLAVSNLIYFIFHCPIFLIFAYLQVNMATYFSFFLFLLCFPSVLFCLIATALYCFSVSFYFFPLFTLLLPVSPFVFLSRVQFYFHIFFPFYFPSHLVFTAPSIPFAPRLFSFILFCLYSSLVVLLLLFFLFTMSVYNTCK